MLTCPNCGSDNRYGAIFCRVCGKKLDIIDEITVENIDEKMGGKKRKKRKKDKRAPTPKALRKRAIIVNAIRIAIILLVAFAVYLTQQMPTLSAIVTSEGGRKAFEREKKKLEVGESAVITEKQLNSYVAGLLPKIEGGKVVTYENIQIALANDKEKGEIAIRMYVRVWGKRMLFQMFGTLKEEDGHVKFSPKAFAKMGKLPYPAFLMKMHCKNVLSGLKDDKELFGKLTSATIKDVKVSRGGKAVSTTGIALKASGKK